ncbi:MAG: hypothetical protein ABI885_29350 [Gammaproteobacteria bacterium]
MLVIALAIILMAAAAAVPILVASALINDWAALPHPEGLQRNLVYWGAWAMVLSVVGLKYTVPLVAALEWQGGARGSILASIIWAAAVFGSSIVVVRGGHAYLLQADHLDGTSVAALALLWIVVEVIGSLAPAAFVAPGRRPWARTRDEAAAIADPENLRIQEASAPSALTADEIFETLRQATARPGLSRYGLVELDRSIRTSHRQLAEAFRMPKNNLARRLTWLRRAGRITVVSTQRETRIFLIDDGADTGGEPSSPP